MIRVLYRWRVPEGGETQFEDGWVRMTHAIRAAFPAAHGSLLLRQDDRPGTAWALARWSSRAEWEAFLTAPSPDEAARDAMTAVSELEGLEVFEEVREE